MREKTILDKIRSEGIKVELITPKQATLEQVATIHGRKYIDQVKASCEQGSGYLDLDPVLSRYSYDAAMRAAGGAMSAVERCWLLFIDFPWSGPPAIMPCPIREWVSASSIT